VFELARALTMSVRGCLVFASFQVYPEPSSPTARAENLCLAHAVQGGRIGHEVDMAYLPR